jgi:hypothetical protein
MRVQRTVLWIMLSVLFVMAASWVVAFLAQDLYPNLAGPIVLVGILAIGLLLGLALHRALRGRREEFMARLRVSERAFCLASALSAVGCLVTSVGKGPVLEVVGMTIAGGGGLAAFWIVLRSVPPHPQ